MKLRVGILGHGYMGAIRRAAFERRSDCEVVRVVEGDDADWSPVLDDPSLDVVAVCVPNDLTCEAVCRALERKKHVLAEKPPGVSTAEVRRMIAAETASGKALKFGFNHRHHPSVRAARAAIAEGALGELLWLRGIYGKPWDPAAASGWRASRARAGGGILLDQGIHVVDLMRMFAGGFDRVHAFAATSFSSEVEDDLVAILGSGPRVGTLHSSHTQWAPRFSLELGFRDGALALRGLLSKTGRYGPEELVRRTRSSPSEQVERFETDDSWDRELEELVRAIRGEAPIEIGSSTEALELMTLVEAIYASAAEGRPDGLR